MQRKRKNIETGTGKWNCTKKQDARDSCIIKSFQALHGLSAIPDDKQYWTLSGICEDDKKIAENSELHQLLEAKFLTRSQFYGVDFDQKVYEKNRHIKKCTWIYGDFVKTLYDYYREGNFNPGVINFDSTQTPKVISHDFGKILHLLNIMKEDGVMVVVTAMCSGRGLESKSPFDDLISTPLAKVAYDEGWCVSNYYHYKREKGKFNMVMLCFFK